MASRVMVKVVKVDKNTISISFPSGTKCVVAEEVDLDLLLQFLAPGGQAAYSRSMFQPVPTGPPTITIFSEENDASSKRGR